MYANVCKCVCLYVHGARIGAGGAQSCGERSEEGSGAAGHTCWSFSHFSYNKTGVYMAGRSRLRKWWKAHNWHLLLWGSGRGGASYHAWQVAASSQGPLLQYFPYVRVDTSGHICGTGVLVMRTPSAAAGRGEAAAAPAAPDSATGRQTPTNKTGGEMQLRRLNGRRKLQKTNELLRADFSLLRSAGADVLRPLRRQRKGFFCSSNSLVVRLNVHRTPTCSGGVDTWNLGRGIFEPLLHFHCWRLIFDSVSHDVCSALA